MRKHIVHNFLYKNFHQFAIEFLFFYHSGVDLAPTHLLHIEMAFAEQWNIYELNQLYVDTIPFAVYL